jgi:hypothetical protein
MSRRVLPIFYVGLALLALRACWRQNLLFMAEQQVDLATGFVVFWPALLANHATTSITIDIALLGLAALTWMVIEARRLGIRFVWAYVVLSFAIAISVTFPLFLLARERARAEQGETNPQLGLGDSLGLVLLGVPIIGFAVWSLWGAS